MDLLSLSGGGRTVDLYPWLSGKARGVEALAGIVGFGLPGVENQWFEGAGSGRTWRGSRMTGRTIELPLKVYAETRTELNDLLSDLAVALDPFRKGISDEVAKLSFGGPDEDIWECSVVRSGGGDWSRKVDSDDRTFFKTTLSLETGDAFWTRSNPEIFDVGQKDAGDATLMPYFAKLQVGSASAFGEQEVLNIGDTYAWPIITAYGPMTRLLLIGADGEKVEWIGSLLSGDALRIDMRNNTVVDTAGMERYSGLATAPRFWSIAPGRSKITVQADSITSESLISVQYWPRRWGIV